MSLFETVPTRPTFIVFSELEGRRGLRLDGGSCFLHFTCPYVQDCGGSGNRIHEDNDCSSFIPQPEREGWKTRTGQGAEGSSGELSI